MSRNLTPTSTQLPLSPGAQAVSTVFTTSGFNAGDYVYAYNGSSVGFPKAATIPMGSADTLIAGAVYSQPITTVDSRAASYGPFSDTATYTGTSVTVGSTVVSPVVLSSSYNNSIVGSAALPNGNVAYIFSTGENTLQGAIYNSAGVIQGSPVTIATTPTLTAARISVCGLSNNGYVVSYYNTPEGTMYLTRVTSTNTIANSFTYYGTVASVAYVTAFNNGFYAVAYFNSMGDATWYVRVYTSTDSLYTAFQSSGSMMYSISIAATSNNDIYVFTKDAGNGAMYRSRYGIGGNLIDSAAGFGFSINGAYNTTAATALSPSTLYATSNNAVVAYNNNSNIICIGRYSGSTIVSNISTGVSGIVQGIAATGGGGFALFYKGSDGLLYLKQYAGDSSLIATVALTSTTVLDNQIAHTASGLVGSKATVGYTLSSDGFARFMTVSTAALTNGVTQFTGTNTYTPNTGYYLLGVAATTAAANTTGLVITNGSATLNSSYPSVTSPINFDYSGNAFTSRSTTNANKGTVVGRTVILKGLE